jgi:hypothetical protein
MLTIVNEYLLIDQIKPSHFAQQFLIFGVHPISATYFFGFGVAVVPHGGFFAADLEEYFEDVG